MHNGKGLPQTKFQRPSLLATLYIAWGARSGAPGIWTSGIPLFIKDGTTGLRDQVPLLKTFLFYYIRFAIWHGGRVRLEIPLFSNYPSRQVVVVIEAVDM